MEKTSFKLCPRSFVSVEGFSTDVVFVAVYHLFVVRNIVIIRKRVK